MTDTNGAGVPGGDSADPAGAAGAAEAGNAQFRILAQYVKDLSFENPDALKVLRGGADQPHMEVSVNVGVTPLDEDHFEVELKFSINAASAEGTVFIVELDYAAVFLIKGIPQESMQPVLLIECPRLVFPFARRIIADMTRDGGYPPLLLEPIDFVGLYRSRLEQQQAARQPDDTSAPGAPTA